MSDRLNDYFVREAAEYLEQIEQYLSLPHESPEAERLVRLTHGARGSIRMAGAERVAEVAERLEAAARSVLSGVLSWSETLRVQMLDTARDIQILLGGLHEWGTAEEERLRSVLRRWDAGAATTGGPQRAGESTGSEAIVPIESLFHNDAGPHVLSVGRAPQTESVAEEGAGDDSAEADGTIVPIESLLLRGPAAARAALALRPRVEQLAAAGGAAHELRELHDEIFDLLTLSISDTQA